MEVVFQTTSSYSGSVRLYYSWHEWYHRLAAANRPQQDAAASLCVPGLVVAEVVDTESGKVVEPVWGQSYERALTQIQSALNVAGCLRPF